jgi:hypothetical protein
MRIMKRQAFTCPCFLKHAHLDKLLTNTRRLAFGDFIAILDSNGIQYQVTMTSLRFGASAKNDKVQPTSRPSSS